MGLTFRIDKRLTRPKADGSPGFVDVKKGHTPEEYGLDPEECAGLLLMDGVDLNELEEALDIAAVIRDMWSRDPQYKTPELWEDDGKPRVDVIEARLGRQITMAERDAAWKLFKSEVNADG